MRAPVERTIGETRMRMRTLGMVTAQDLILLLALPLAAFVADATRGGLPTSKAPPAPPSPPAEGEERAAGWEPPAKPAIPTDLILERLAQGLPGALRELSPEALKQVTDTFAARTEILFVDTKGRGKETWMPLAQHYDNHFDGRVEEWVEWVAWGISLNRLFGSAGERFSALAATLKGSSFPTGATPSSGDSSSIPA